MLFHSTLLDFYFITKRYSWNKIIIYIRLTFFLNNNQTIYYYYYFLFKALISNNPTKRIIVL